MKIGHPIRLFNGCAIDPGTSLDKIVIQIMNPTHKHVDVGLGGGASRARRVQSTRFVGLGEVERDVVAADTAVRRGIGPQEVLSEPKHRYIVIDGSPDVIDKQDWSMSAQEGNREALRC